MSDKYIGIKIYQSVYFNYVILCMILQRGRLGLMTMQEIPLYWSGMMTE